MTMDNARRIIDMTAIRQRNLDFIQSCSREVRSRNNILVARDFLNNGVNQSGLAHIGHADYINITSLAAIFNLVNQVLDCLLVLSRGQYHIDWTQAFFVSPLRQPLGHLAILDRLWQNVLFIPNQENIVSSNKARQSRNDRAIKVKNVDNIDDQGVTISNFVEKPQKVIIRQLNIADFIIMAQSETALTIEFACLQAFFQS